MAFSVLVEGLDHPESVAKGPDGNLYAGGEAGQVYRIDWETKRLEQIADTGGFILGVTLDGDGRIYLCDTGRRELIRVTGGSLEVISSGTPERPMVNPNWSAFLPDGTLFVSDSGHWKKDDGWMYRVEPGGRTSVWSTECTGFPNGFCLDRQGGALLIAESTTPALSRIPINADGSAGRREVVAELPGIVPDGVAIDSEGNAYVSCYRPDRILKVDAQGRVTTVADDPEGTLLAAPTNSCFAGPGLRTFVTAHLGRWHLTAAELGAAGHPLHMPRGLA